MINNSSYVTLSRETNGGKDVSAELNQNTQIFKMVDV